MHIIAAHRNAKPLVSPSIPSLVKKPINSIIVQNTTAFITEIKLSFINISSYANY